MGNIDINQFYENTQNLGPNDLLLDVRTAEEFDEGHIKGARNVAHEEVGSVAEELKSHDKVYVFCKMGGRAQRATEILESSGLTNIICVGQGGMHAWMEKGWPVE